MDSLRGKLLVAAPTLADPNFVRTVVLIAEHGADGALGVVLNRPSDAAVGDVVPDLHEMVADEELIFVGGPVQPEGVLVLAEFDDPGQAALTLDGDLGFVALESDIEAVGGATRRARAFADTPAGARASSTPSSRRRRGSSPPSTVRTPSPRIPTSSGAAP